MLMTDGQWLMGIMVKINGGPILIRICQTTSRGLHAATHFGPIGYRYCVRQAQPVNLTVVSSVFPLLR